MGSLIRMARLAACAALLAPAGCATIVSKSSQTIIVGSRPQGAAVTIINHAGTPVHSGTTPFSVTLKKGAGYFKKENYIVRFAKDGFTSGESQITVMVSGWYYGNIVFGGLLGMLAIDPSTGAMYRLAPKEFELALEPLKASDQSPPFAIN